MVSNLPGGLQPRIWERQKAVKKRLSSPLAEDELVEDAGLSDENFEAGRLAEQVPSQMPLL